MYNLADLKERRANEKKIVCVCVCVCVCVFSASVLLYNVSPCSYTIQMQDIRECYFFYFFFF